MVVLTHPTNIYYIYTIMYIQNMIYMSIHICKYICVICVFFFSATFLKKSFFHSTPGPPDHKTNPKKSTPASWLTASASAQLVFFYSERPQSRRPEKPVGFVENLWDFDNDDAKNDRVAWPDMFQEDILWIFCIYIYIYIYI